MNSADYITFVSGLDVDSLRNELRELKDRMSLIEVLIKLKSEPGTATFKDIEMETEMEEGDSIPGEAVISENDLKYGLLRFPAGSRIAEALPKGSQVMVEFKDERFMCSIPKLDNYPSQKGRLNGFSKIYRGFEEFESGRTVSVGFNKEANIIKIIKVE
ncbi:hypothetical protein [Paenibacillus sp. FSL R7-0331]|uniref:hypothetical protein n=1 Tax=Paenibacillus sp. FSL R7-0331 TaxID=1536773 RepID=UPI0004F62C7A|nr:hypothetical protein [Paenibacillus sp. FSL R7-0331]AIQ53967.1 hypothetical protein R70331_22150 [Paenibacillus sp. FSL R7-0331]